MKNIFLMLLLLSTFPAASHSSCVDDFLERLDGYIEFELKKDYIKSLSKEELKCLYDHAKLIGPDQHDLFISHQNFSQTTVQKFYGVISLPLFREFEKHFFSIRGKIFGYNRTQLGSLIGSPGIFSVEFVNEKTAFNYARDFTLLLNPDDLLKWKKSELQEIKNNHWHLVFGGLWDHLRFMGENILIGKAMKEFPPSSLSLTNYFLMIEIPEGQKGINQPLKAVD